MTCSVSKNIFRESSSVVCTQSLSLARDRGIEMAQKATAKYL